MFKEQQERQKGWSWVGVGAQETTTSKDTRGRLLLSHDDKRSPMKRAPVFLSQWHLQGLERYPMNGHMDGQLWGGRAQPQVSSLDKNRANIKRC